jgi:hypothetical protein
LDCHCYDSNGKPLKAAADKPAESKKSHKMFGGNESMAFMQTMVKAYVKAQKAGKSKKRKKRNYDSSDSSNSQLGTGSGNTGFSVDKRLKIDDPLGSVYLSSESPSIKVANTTPSNNMSANAIAIKTAKTSKVTAVVAVMSICCKKKCKLRSFIPVNEKNSCQKPESADSPKGNYCRSRHLSQKTRKGHLPKKLVP